MLKIVAVHLDWSLISLNGIYAGVCRRIVLGASRRRNVIPRSSFRRILRGCGRMLRIERWRIRTRSVGVNSGSGICIMRWRRNMGEMQGWRRKSMLLSYRLSRRNNVRRWSCRWKGGIPGVMVGFGRCCEVISTSERGERKGNCAWIMGVYARKSKRLGVVPH